MVLTAVVALLATAGCGPTGSDSSGPIVRPAATHSTTPSAFPGLTARQIVDRAVSATRSASAVTVNMRITTDGSTVHLTGAMTRSGKCAASMVVDGYNLQVIRTTTTTYIKGDAAFWRAKGGTHGAAMAKMLAGKWLVIPKAKAASVSHMCDLREIMSAFSDDMDGTTFKRGAVVTVAGRQAMTVEETASDDPADLLVATHGTPYILRVFSPVDSSKDVTFSHFDQPPRISAPPARDTLDLSAFGNPDISV